MPFGYGVPPDRPKPDNTAKFGKDLIEDVIPYIEAPIAPSPIATNRAIVGLSMGGGQSLNIGLNNIDLFSYVGGFSAASAMQRTSRKPTRTSPAMPATRTAS